MFEQLGAVVEATGLSADLAPDLDEIIRGEVRQPAVLEIRPELFHRVQFRRVRRQPHQGPPADSVHRPPHEARSMGQAVVPEEERWAAEMSPEVAHEASDVRRADILAGVERQVKGDAAPTRRDDQGTDAGQFLVTPCAQ